MITNKWKKLSEGITGMREKVIIERRNYEC